LRRQFGGIGEIRIYARENATQRGAAVGTSLAGSVAAAFRETLKMVILSGENDSESGAGRANRDTSSSRTRPPP